VENTAGLGIDFVIPSLKPLACCLCLGA